VDVFLSQCIQQGTGDWFGSCCEALLRVLAGSSTRLRRRDIEEDGLSASVQSKLMQIEEGEIEGYVKDNGMRAADLRQCESVRDLDYDPDLG
jgi:hypothetical protein